MIKKYKKFINESYHMCQIEDLLGKTLKDIDVSRDEYQNDKIVFTVNDGTEYQMYHSNDCSESVDIDDIDGDLNDLIGYPILQAKKVTNNSSKFGKKVTNSDDDAILWTFYKLATIKGYVVIRWFGGSNGYYSMEVDFYKTK